MKDLIRPAMLSLIVQTFIGCDLSTTNEKPSTATGTEKASHNTPHIMMKAEQD